MFQGRITANGRAEAASAGPISDETDADARQSRRYLDLARKRYRERRIRARYFPPRLFAEPVWDILLDLFIARHQNLTITVSSACIAADVPVTTALRHIAWLVEDGWVIRSPHPSDARSSVVGLTPDGDRAMRAYLDDIDR